MWSYCVEKKNTKKWDKLIFVLRCLFTFHKFAETNAANLTNRDSDRGRT